MWALLQVADTIHNLNCECDLDYCPNLFAFCGRCKSPKPLDEFGNDKRKRNGKKSICKPCEADVGREWTRKNPHKVRLSNAKQYAKNAKELQRLSAERAKQHFDDLTSSGIPKRKEYQLRSTYGISADIYAEILATQGNGCAICGDPAPANGRLLAVDHSHDTGEIRGLLCGKHNLALGGFDDDPDLLARAIEYLKTARTGHITWVPNHELEW